MKEISIVNNQSEENMLNTFINEDKIIDCKEIFNNCKNNFFALNFPMNQEEYNKHIIMLDNLFKTMFDNLNIISNSYDYIILITRRCFVLTSSVFNLIKEKNQYKVFWNKVISSQSVDTNSSLFKDQRILLVDDIMIHGKAVYLLHEKITMCGAKQVDTLVFARNVEIPDFYRIAVGKYQYFLYLEQEDWKWLSNQIVYYFTFLGVPYISFLYSYLIPDKTSLKFDFLKKIDLKSNNEQFPAEEIREDLFYTPCEYDANIFTNIYLRECKYKDKFSEKINKTIYIPYCILSPISTDNIMDSWNKFCTNVNDDFLCKKINDFQSIYKTLTVIGNLIFMNQTCSNFILNESLDIDKSFFDGFYSLILKFYEKLKLKKCDTIQTFSQKLTDSGFVFLNHEKSKTINVQEYPLSNLLPKYGKLYREEQTLEKFDEYISDVSLKEDQVFNDLLMSLYSLPEQLSKKISSIKNQLPLDFVLNAFDNSDEFLAEIIKKTEIGIISLLVDIIVVENGKQYVGTVLKTGEQSYRIFYENNREAFIYSSAFYDAYVFLHGYNKLTSQDIDAFIEYCKSNGFEPNIIQSMGSILNIFNESELPDIFHSYNALVKKSDLATFNNNLNIVMNYFKN